MKNKKKISFFTYAILVLRTLVTNFKHGIDCYTYTATKAKSAMESAFILHTITKDKVTKTGYYPHYHAYLFGQKKSILGHTMHSFYGDAVENEI